MTSFGRNRNRIYDEVIDLSRYRIRIPTNCTDKQQQCGYDMVSLDRRDISYMSCNMLSVWPLADGR